ncbi:MAG: glycosyl hydrolase, partial [Bacteroidota bacterium]
MSFKILFIVLFVLISLNKVVIAQSNNDSDIEWKKKYNFSQAKEKFSDPPLFYAPHTFWFWDTALDTAQTASMAKEMTKQRLNPGYAHPRHSEAPASAFPALPQEEWLSPLWFKSFESAAREADRAGMTLGYCDEYWWPSGRADGKVLEQDPDLAAKSLEWVRIVGTEGTTLNLPTSKVTVAAKLSKDTLLISSTLKIIGEGEAFSWKVPKGNWIIYSYSIEKSKLDVGNVNYLNPKLMDVFIPIAHESYFNSVGKYMGNVIPGVFVDNEGDYGSKMAWSEYLVERHQEMKGSDMRKYLPLLTEKDSEGLWVKARYDWFDVVSDIYSKQFLGRLSDWLYEHDMYYISNLWEESLLLQTRAVGDFMRAQREVTMPGNDCLLMYSQNVHDFKETQSVCEFEDRPFMTELMGVAGWQQTPSQMKMTINAVTAWGVTHTVPHGINLNRKLETIPYPADWFTENPFWRYLHLWTDFARRASFVNRQGQLAADILIFNPLESVWALSEGYFTSAAGDEWPDKAVEINNTYSEAMNILTKSWLDYLIGDNYYLDKAEIVKPSDGVAKLKIGTHEFSVLVLPSMFILSQSTSDKILEFAKSGGMVVILGDLPKGSPQVGLNDPIIVNNMNQLVKLRSVMNLSNEPDKMNLIPSKIKEVIESQMEMIAGELPLLISHRKIDNKDFYWLANNSGVKQTVTLSLRDGNGSAEIWDCETGEIRSVLYSRDNGRNKIELQFDSYEAFWLVFNSSGETRSVEKSRPSDLVELEINGPWQINYPETNKIQVTSTRSLIIGDTITHSKYLGSDFDDSEWNYLNIVGNIRLEGAWNASMFYNPDPDTKRFYRYEFDLAEIPKGAIVNINGDNGVKFWINGESVVPGKNAESWSVFDTHPINSLLRKGKNVIAVEEKNHLGYGWMVFQGLIHFANGEEMDLVSNSNWKESDKLFPNWQNIQFDDRSWKSPTIADEKVSSFNFLRMRPPNKILFSKSSVWWRIDVVPNAEYLLLPGLSDKAEIWVDGEEVSIHNGKVILLADSKVVVIKNGEDASGLSQPAAFYCSGSSTTNLVSWLDMGLRRFTGFIDYETTFDLPSENSSITIDLGNVRYMAEVWLNEKKIGERLWAPFTFRTETSRIGENKLRVR